MDISNKEKIRQGGLLFRDNELSILFVTSQLRPRELKMAYGLKKLGWKVALIYFKWTPFDSGEYFDLAIEASSVSQAHAYAKALSPRICHVFSGAIDELVLALCRDKPAPVVIDLNDVFAPSLFDYCHERFEPTKEALALADGFCARDLQVKSAEKVDGFSLPPHIILFPEYCWNSTTNDGKTGCEFLSKEVHVVSVGTFSLESQGMFDSCYLRLAKLMVEQQIHFHIYPHWAYRRDHMGSPHADFERDFADFLSLEKLSPYLHVHDSLPIEELAEVLPQYDFGIVSGGCEALGQKLGFYHPAYLETCYSGRISDYLDARLPVLINSEVKFDYWLLKRYDICVNLEGVLQPGFKQSLLDLKRDAAQREAMERAVQRLSVDHNSPRLAQFYREIIASKILHKIVKTPMKGYKLETDIPVAANSVSTATAAIGAQTFSFKRLIEFLWGRVRLASPRIAKIVLPYRAIRLLEVRLHNALIDIQSSRATIATLSNQLAGLEQDKEVLRTQLAGLEQDKEILRTQLAGLEQDKAQNTELAIHSETLQKANANLEAQVHVLSNEKFLMQQESKWGALSLNKLAGVLNWPQVLNDVERTNGFAELVRILRLYSTNSNTLDRSSACWEILNVKNLDQLLAAGYDNFKRTIGLNYFNFLVQKDDPQICALESILKTEECGKCWEIAGSVQDDPSFPCPDQRTYRYFVLLLWIYLQQVDKKGYAGILKEPLDGNPLWVHFGDRQITQDLANSILEYYSMSECVQFENISRVLEIGGGYGRNAYVVLALNPNVKMTMVDIPPALFLTQRYLSSVFRGRRVFYVREFASYDEVKDEMEKASIVLLMPHQLKLLPDAYFDVSYNISSFGEMGRDQIAQYFEQLERLTSLFFYTKQWQISNNVFDGVLLKEEDYPFGKNWTKVYSRSCPVQSDFFEALYQTGGESGKQN